MGIWKLSDFWAMVTDILIACSSFFTSLFAIFHYAIPSSSAFPSLVGAVITFGTVLIKIIFADKDGDGIVDIFQMKKKWQRLKQQEDERKN